MKKAATLFAVFVLTCLFARAQSPTASTVTLAPRLNPNNYVTVPDSAFQLTTPPGTSFQQMVLTQFPTSTQSLRITKETGPVVYTSLPAGGLYIPTYANGKPKWKIEVFPTANAQQIQFFYQVFNSQSQFTPTACIFIPFYYPPLAIELTRFTAEADGGSAMISWSTASEEHLRGFHIEWSSNGADWTAVGTLAARGVGNDYQFVHKTPETGNNYYRLRSEGIDGTSEFSQVAHVLFERAAIAITVKPNPVRDVLHIESPAGSNVSLFDLTGKEVGRLQASEHSLNMQHLTPGLYQLTIRNATGGILAQERIVKQ